MSDLLESLCHEIRTLGDSLTPYFANVDPEVKADGTWLTEADNKSHQALMTLLPQLVNLPVLSEELTPQAQQRIISESKEGYWCVDPLDGTSNFTQGISYWCVSVGLVVAGDIKLGVVYDPNRQELFAAEGDHPTTLNGETLVTNPINELANSTALIDLKRIPKQVSTQLISDAPYRSQRCFGASALDFCWIAADRCQLYLHGEQQLWDYVAGKKILHNTGGHSRTFANGRVFQNDLVPKSVIAASSLELMKQWQTYFTAIHSA